MAILHLLQHLLHNRTVLLYKFIQNNTVMLVEWLQKLYLLKYIGYTVYTRCLLCKLAITEHKHLKQKT